MTVNINEIVRLTLEYSQPASSIPMNVFCFSMQTAAIDESEVVDTLEDWATTLFGPAWAALAGSACTMDTGQVAVINNDGTVNRNIGSFTIAQSGSQGTEIAPAANAGYLLAYTAVPKTRGSKYLPGVAEGILSNGELTVAAQASLSACLILYLATINTTSGGKLVPGVLSRTAAAFRAFNTSGIIESIPAYQRRRKPSVGI